MKRQAKVRLFTLFSLLLFFCSFNLYAQEQLITINVENASLREVVSAIEKQTTYRFSYRDVVVDNEKNITISQKNVPVSAVLDDALKGRNLSYSVVSSKSIVLSEKKNDAALKSSGNGKTVSGNIKDETGEPIIGADVSIKGTSIGTVTDADGNFTLDNVPQGSTLVISYIGMNTKEVVVDNSPSFAITMTNNTVAMNEVVVVGYGTQKKINLSGSVASVSGTTLAQSPAPTFTNLLEGRLAGVTLAQPTGEPGSDGSGNLMIRGQGSFGAGFSPLVLVDGIPSSLNALNPQDIASVSVLKDATSASIYGSRAANGVILVTTKKGQSGTPTISYTNNIGTSSATILPKLLTNSAQYMQLFNQALERSGQPDNYTQDQINSYANNPGSKYYPNTDWMKYYFKNGAQQQHTLTLSGANDASDYYVSIGYQNQKGLLKVYDYDRYNALFNYNTKVTKWAKIGTSMNLIYQNNTTPVQTNSDLMLEILAQAPTFAPFLPDGSGRRANKDYADNGMPNRTVDEVYLMGQNTNIGYNVNAQAYIDIDLFKGLDWKTTGSVAYYDQNYKSRYIPVSETVYAFQPDAAGNYIPTNPYSLGNYLWQQAYRTLTTMVNSVLNYNKDFGTDHHLTALLGYEQVENIGNVLNGARYNYLNNLNEMDAGPSDGQYISGNTSDDALQSFFGRANYNYQGKYFVEGDFRYDGTSRINPKYRWGTFGGVSAAWRISEEKFIKNNVSWLNDLKLRASYGSLGNQSIATYAYQAVLSNTQYNVDGALAPGVVLTSLPANNLKWETTTTTDLGLDLTLFKGLLGATFDWYNKNTTNILAAEADLPYTVGLNAPTINAGSMRNRGFELELTHQNHIGQFEYGLNFLIAANRNVVTKMLAPNLGIDQVGLPWNSFFLYQMGGIFQSQDEINNSPAQPNSGILKPGDIKIKDVNGDGKITPDDRISVSSFPDFTYSFGGNAGYKGFKLTAFFQGVKDQKVLLSYWGLDPYIQGTAPTLDFLKNAWTPENHSNTTPALYLRGYTGVAGYTSTYYLKDASYLRLKELNFSYTFPQRILKISWLKDLTLYVSGSNLLTFTPFKDGDPERTAGIGGSSPGFFAQYPQIKIISGGIKISLQ